MGFDSKCKFAPPTILLGLLCLGCGITPHSLCSTTQLPLQHLQSCWGFFDLGHGVPPHSHSSATLKQKQHPLVDVIGDRSKVQCCKEQYCIGTWNVRSMNQSKLEVVKQEMARVNVNILGISELKWTGMGEFNSDDHYIYYCGQESLRRNGVAIIVNKRVWNAVLWYNLKNDRIISVCFQGKPFNITVIQVFPLISNAEEAELNSSVNTYKTF